MTVAPETHTVRFPGELQRFVQSKISGDGLYSSASEYFRDLRAARL